MFFLLFLSVIAKVGLTEWAIPRPEYCRSIVDAARSNANATARAALVSEGYDLRLLEAVIPPTREQRP